MKRAKVQNIEMLAFADCHEPTSIEFDAYPPHCLVGSTESEIIDELKEVGDYELVLKRSTNGFLEPAFHEWLAKHPQINQFICRWGLYRHLH